MTFLDELRMALGDAVSTDTAALGCLTTDKSGYDSRSVPLALVTARSIDDVRATLRLASEYRVAVVPRGAG